MINKIFLKFLTFFIFLFDHTNKKKIIKILDKKLKDKNLTIIDIGSHKGETIELFLKNFNIQKIFAFEPNIELFNLLKRKKKYETDKIELFNYGVGLDDGELDLNIMTDSSSSTFNTMNLDSNYYKKKNKIVNLFSRKKDLIEKRQAVSIIKLSKIILQYRINHIDILKIDTEGFEFKILKGINFKRLQEDQIYIF